MFSECTLRNHESRENDFLGGENRALLKFSGFEEYNKLGFWIFSRIRFFEFFFFGGVRDQPRRQDFGF